jgi:hypothetical protein
MTNWGGRAFVTQQSPNASAWVRLSPIFAPSFLFLPLCFPIFGWQFVVIDPRGQAPMGLPMLGRAILLLEISTLVAFNLAAVNGEPSPYSFSPSLNW